MSETRFDSAPTPPGEEAWRALVAKTLGEKPPESLKRATAEGLPIEPLYAPAERPAAFPPRPFDAERPWEVRTLSAHPDPSRVNAELMADLAGGAASVILKGHAAPDALARALKDVIVEAAPVGLDVVLSVELGVV